MKLVKLKPNSMSLAVVSSMALGRALAVRSRGPAVVVICFLHNGEQCSTSVERFFSFFQVV